MTMHRVVVSFTTYVEAEDTDGVDEQINELLDELQSVNTTLTWDECEWETFFKLEGESNE